MFMYRAQSLSTYVLIAEGCTEGTKFENICTYRNMRFSPGSEE